jgi:hypothetical protein
MPMKADIKAIAQTDLAAHKSNSEITLDVLRSTQQLVDTLLAQAQKPFDFDGNVANAGGAVSAIR